VQGKFLVTWFEKLQPSPEYRDACVYNPTVPLLVANDSQAGEASPMADIEDNVSEQPADGPSAEASQIKQQRCRLNCASQRSLKFGLKVPVVGCGELAYRVNTKRLTFDSVG